MARGIELLQTADPSIPAVYGLRTRLIDEDGNEIGFSPLFRKLPGFRCAHVQSIAGGNTMISNQTARELLVFYGPDVNVPSHDWWLYQVTCTSCGNVIYDACPAVRDQQHGRNVIGSNMGWLARMQRLRMPRQGQFRDWTDLNITALTRHRPRMSAEKRQVFDLFGLSAGSAWQPWAGRGGGAREYAQRSRAPIEETWKGQIHFEMRRDFAHELCGSCVATGSDGAVQAQVRKNRKV